MGLAITTEKIGEPKRVSILRATNDNWSHRAIFKQADPAEDECPHDPLAELSLSD